MTLRFHRSLYDADAVRRAATRFAPLAADLRVEDHGDDVLVHLDGVRESVRDRIGGELGNHALFETIVARRSA